MRIQPYDPAQLDAVVRLSLRAWIPVFDALQKVMDVDVCRAFHPDWCVSQQQAVEGVCVQRTPRCGWRSMRVALSALSL